MKISTLFFAISLFIITSCQKNNSSDGNLPNFDYGLVTYENLKSETKKCFQRNHEYLTSLNAKDGDDINFFLKKTEPFIKDNINKSFPGFQNLETFYYNNKSMEEISEIINQVNVTNEERNYLNKIIDAIENNNIELVKRLNSEILVSNPFSNDARYRIVSLTAIIDGTIEYYNISGTNNISLRSRCGDAIGNGALVGAIGGALTGLYKGCSTGVFFGFNPGSAAAGCLIGLIGGMIGGAVGGAAEGVIECAINPQ